MTTVHFCFHVKQLEFLSDDYKLTTLIFLSNHKLYSYETGVIGSWGVGFAFYPKLLKMTLIFFLSNLV